MSLKMSSEAKSLFHKKAPPPPPPSPPDTGCKLTYIRPGSLLNVLSTFNLGPMSRG